MKYDAVADPIEKSCEMQAGHDQHHGEKQYKRAEINAPDCRLRRQDTEDEHQDRADHGHGWAIDLGAGQAPEREDEIAGEENDPGSNDLPISKKNVADIEGRHRCSAAFCSRYKRYRVAGCVLARQNFMGSDAEEIYLNAFQH